MQIAGSCPGMIFVQIGSGVKYSFITLVGGLAGALTHGVLNNYMTKTSQPDQAASRTLYELFNVNENKFRIFFISGLFGAVGLMEFFVPWKSDYSPINTNVGSFSLSSDAWSPAFAGCLLGSLQMLSFYLMSKSLGSSSAFSSIASCMVSKSMLEKSSYLKRFKSGLSNMGQLVFVGSVGLGSFVSSNLSGVYGKAMGVHPYNAFLGGFLLVFGARLAGGCNTGHGISGTSHLFTGSFVAMMSMFAGAISLGVYALTNDFFLK